MAASDGERGPGRARRAITGRANLAGLRAFEGPGAPRSLRRAHDPTPLAPVCTLAQRTVPGAHELTIGSCLN